MIFQALNHFEANKNGDLRLYKKGTPNRTNKTGVSLSEILNLVTIGIAKNDADLISCRLRRKAACHDNHCVRTCSLLHLHDFHKKKKNTNIQECERKPVMVILLP